MTATTTTTINDASRGAQHLQVSCRRSGRCGLYEGVLVLAPAPAGTGIGESSFPFVVSGVQYALKNAELSNSSLIKSNMGMYSVSSSLRSRAPRARPRSHWGLISSGAISPAVATMGGSSSAVYCCRGTAGATPSCSIDAPASHSSRDDLASRPLQAVRQLPFYTAWLAAVMKSVDKAFDGDADVVSASGRLAPGQSATAASPSRAGWAR